MLTALVLVGGLAAPLLLLDGLARTAASAASLLLNLELPLTALVAVLWFREHLSGREWLGTTLVGAGAAWLTLRSGASGGSASLRGDLSVAGACALWALDTNLTQRLSTRDPRAVVAVKGLGAAGVGALAALAVHARAPSFATAWRGVLLGAASYGASLLLYVHALRDLGAARAGALFASAPFVAALAALTLLPERPSLALAGAGLIMAAGVALIVRAPHDHEHAHEVLEHSHRHVHDAHHQHAHRGDEGPEPHAHPHRHEPLVHAHPHASDLHHRHKH
jgi:drug/metabolite transporter (DMT)-like permease